MNVLLINLDKAILYPPRIQSYIESKGVNCYLSKWSEVEINKVLKIHKLTPINTVIHPRTAGPHVNKIYKDLENKGYLLINPFKSLELISDKYRSQIFAKEQGIVSPDSFKVSKNNIDLICDLLKKYESIVCKPIFSQGLGKFCKKINDDAKTDRIRELLKDIPGNEIVVQEYIKYKKLIRVIVIGYKALEEATTYDEPKKSWKASVCMNPNLKKYTDYNPKLFKAAEKTAKIFNSEIAFIDFFEDHNNEIILNELNTACAFVIHEDVTGVKIHEFIGDYLIKKVKLLEKSGKLQNKKNNWSKDITEHSVALDLEEGVFTWDEPRKIAESLKRSAENSMRRKGTLLQSAMSMLNFYINRAGNKLSPERKEILEKAKVELRRLFNK